MNTWPELEQLPTNVKTALIKHLLEPFQNLSEAKAYWEESGTSLVIGEMPIDAVDEYTDPLPEGYTISVRQIHINLPHRYSRPVPHSREHRSRALQQ